MFDWNISIAGVFRLLARLSIVALVAPWVALALVRRAFELLVYVGTSLAMLRYVRATHLRCPRGHASALRGIFECRTCGALFAGWAFERCPTCATSCGYVACEHCGLAVRNPLLGL